MEVKQFEILDLGFMIYKSANWIHGKNPKSEIVNLKLFCLFSCTPYQSSSLKIIFISHINLRKEWLVSAGKTAWEKPTSWMPFTTSVLPKVIFQDQIQETWTMAARASELKAIFCWTRKAKKLFAFCGKQAARNFRWMMIHIQNFRNTLAGILAWWLHQMMLNW